MSSLEDLALTVKEYFKLAPIHSVGCITGSDASLYIIERIEFIIACLAKHDCTAFSMTVSNSADLDSIRIPYYFKKTKVDVKNYKYTGLGVIHDSDTYRIEVYAVDNLKRNFGFIVWGLAFSRKISTAYLETRWTLVYKDKVKTLLAKQIAASLYPDIDQDL